MFWEVFMLAPRGFARGVLVLVCWFAAATCLPLRAQAESITVTHWGAQFFGAPYAVAMDKGFFKKEGVDITGILTAAGGGTAVRNVLSGGIPYGEVALSAALQAINSGQKLVIVAAGTQSVADFLWAVKPDSPLHGIKDLAGKRVTFTAPNSTSNMLILMALQANGMTAQQVQMIPAGDLGANLSAVTSGAVEAAFSDEFVLAQNPTAIRPLFYVRDVMSPRMMQTVCITTREFAQAHPETVRALIAARRDGLLYMQQHPEESADIIARAYSNPNTELMRAHIKRLVSLDYWSDGRFDYKAMDQMVEGLRITGQIKGAVDWTPVVDSSYLPAELRAAK